MNDKEKAERLATALRDNLRKRKAQARSLSEQTERERDGQGDRDQRPDG